MLFQLATGGGKTAIAGAVAEGLAARQRSLLALVHRHELVDQFCATLDRVGLSGRYGIIAAGRAPSPWAPFQVASIQTLHRRAGLELRPHFVVVDEAHHARARTWDEVISRFPSSKVLGLTATPARLDGKPLGRYFEKLVSGPSIKWLVAHGWLAPVTLKYVPRGALSKGARKHGGDYSRKDMAARLNREAIAAPVLAFLRHARDRRAVYFAVNTQDSRAVAEGLVERGVKAAHVDGKTPRQQRDQLFSEFREGHVQVLCNVDIMSEGTDVPACDCVIMGCPTMSLVRYLQQAGRGMRPDHGRDMLLIDTTAENIWRHGAPDEERYWPLHHAEPRPQKRRPAAFSMRVCVHCATVYHAQRGACPECGKAQPMEVPKHLDVELLTREFDEEVAPKPKSTMAQVRTELRGIMRQKIDRRTLHAAIREIRDKHGLGSRWEQNVIGVL